MTFLAAPEAEALLIEIWVILRSRSHPTSTGHDRYGCWGRGATWPERIRKQARVVGVADVLYKQVTVGDFDRAIPSGCGREIGETFWKHTSDQ
jgi:hypothetical protein